MANKDLIISEIKRTALENDGIALGLKRFEKVTGIKQSSWWGKYWRTWGEAVKEAGFLANKKQTAIDKIVLIEWLARITKDIKKFPASVDVRLAKTNYDKFPSHSVFERLGSQHRKIELVRKYATEHEEYADILKFLPQSKGIEEISDKDRVTNTRTQESFVYLGMLKIGNKKCYKIGKTNLVDRRSTELSLQLPEKLELVHYIKTDDMSGIEAYWHKRFADKNTNGEWFDLSSDEVRAFKLRKFM